MPQYGISTSTRIGGGGSLSETANVRAILATDIDSGQGLTGESMVYSDSKRTYIDPDTGLLQHLLCGEDTYNGSSDYERIRKYDPTGDGGKYLSAFVWMNGASQSGRMFCHWENVDQRSWQMTGNAAALRVYLSDDGSYDVGHRKEYSGGTVLDSTWHHAGFTWNNGTLKLYIDGAEVTPTKTTDDAITIVHPSTGDLTVGARLNGGASEEYFTGSISTAKTFPYAMTPAEVLTEYGKGRQPARFEDPNSEGRRGVLLEPAGANILLDSRDITGWTTSNMTAAQTSVGIDGGANKAVRLTATAGNATIIMDALSSSTATDHVYSLWLKRITGTGDVDITIDNGTTWTTKTLTAGWTRHFVTKSAANPQVGIRLVTDTDAVDVDCHQLEYNKSFPSSWIDTSGVAIGSDLVTDGGFPTLSTDSVTQANMRISAVDGTAFTDFSTADVLTDYIGKVLTIKDSAGKAISGYIKAAGSGETSGAQLVTNGDFATGDPPTGWIPTRSAAASETGAGNFNVTPGCKVTVTAGQASGNIYREANLSALALVKMSVWLKNGDATVVQAKIDTFTTGDTICNTGQVTPAAMTQYTKYGTQTVGNTKVYVYPLFVFGDGKYGYTDDLVLQQVTAPSATGATIVSTPGGTTYNWAVQESGFNYNDSSGYTYEIYDTTWQYGTGWFPCGTKASKIAGTASNLEQSGTAAVANKTYQLASTIERTAGTVTPEFGSTDGEAISAAGTYYDYPISADTDFLKFKADATFAGTVDVVTAKEHGRTRLTESGYPLWDAPASVFDGTGTMVFLLRTGFDEDEVSSDGAFVSCDDAVASLAYHDVSGNGVASHDGTTEATEASAFTKATWYKVAVKWNHGSTKFSVGIEAVGSTFDASSWGTEQAWDGSYSIGSYLRLGYGLQGPLHISDVRIWKRILEDAEINGIN